LNVSETYNAKPKPQERKKKHFLSFSPHSHLEMIPTQHFENIRTSLSLLLASPLLSKTNQKEEKKLSEEKQKTKLYKRTIFVYTFLWSKKYPFSVTLLWHGEDEERRTAAVMQVDLRCS